MSHLQVSKSLLGSINQVGAILASTISRIFDNSSNNEESHSSRWSKVKEVLAMNWHLGFTAFGSPPVHFQIFHKKFVEKHHWIDEQLYQELFGLSQALPGPASTKMLFCINYIRNGFSAGVLAFFLWSLPGAIAMYGLSLGVSQIGDKLPGPVYALLSGLNAATVGIIALAAVQLAEKAITDKLTRLLVFFGGAAGMLYTSLWYYPVLMAVAGSATVVWDQRWLHRLFRPFWKKRQLSTEEARVDEISTGQATCYGPVRVDETTNPPPLRRTIAPSRTPSVLPSIISSGTLPRTQSRESERVIPPGMQLHLLTWKTGFYILLTFLCTFILIILLRALVKNRPLGLSLFANLYLAGTIIFGGGPVVIPLLREYIVAEGWVSPRDFLLGLAIIQAFPGPNFNFAVYLGALSTANSSLPSAVGAILAFVGIFTPGLVIVTGVIGLWSVLRSKRWLLSLLRGVNAGAVGLVFTAVYKLWQIGYLDGVSGAGGPLGGDAWWVAVTAGSFVGGKWFGISAPLAILMGGALGLVWYGVVKA